MFVSWMLQGAAERGSAARIALARGLVAKPDLLLLDEPLSNLGALLRESVRTQLHELHSRLNFTAVFVTHDQSEALSLGDRLAIMRDGVIEQFDTPEQIFDQPATEYVAAFVGMSNLLEFTRRDDGWTCNGEPVTGEPTVRLPATRQVVRLRLRPEDLLLSPPETPVAHTATITGFVDDAEFGGRHLSVTVSSGGGRIPARVPAGGRDSWARKLVAGQKVCLGFRAADARRYDESGRLVVPA